MAQIFGTIRPELLIGTPLADEISGLEDDDRLFGGGGIDQLFGGPDNDELTGGPGDDQIFGLSEDDTAIWNLGDGSDEIDGGTGTDTVQLNGADPGLDAITVRASGSNVALERAATATVLGAEVALPIAAQTLTISNVEALEFNGLGGNDRLTAEALSGTGLQLITFNGGAGADTALGATVGMVMNGGPGEDSLTGGTLNDVITGGPGRDTVNGGGGNDRLIVNRGDDGASLDGGTGIDTVQLNGSTNAEVFFIASIIEDFSQPPQEANFDVMNYRNVEEIEVNGMGGDDILAPFPSVRLFTFHGGDGDDRIQQEFSLTPGDPPPLVGLQATVIAFGDAGNDGLRGGSGRDILDGGTGNDFLAGDGGDDLLTGGPGGDRFSYTGGNDGIQDFTPGEDTISLNLRSDFGLPIPLAALRLDDAAPSGVLDDADSRVTFNTDENALLLDFQGLGGGILTVIGVDHLNIFADIL